MIRRPYLPALLVLVCAFLALPALAYAAAPPSAGITIAAENFDNPPNYDSHLTIRSISNPFEAAAWWGRISASHASGSYGLWCAGSIPASWPVYPELTQGSATFDVPELAYYYSSTLSFKYTMPSLGAADADSFNVAWRTPTGPTSYLWDYHVFAKTIGTAWSPQSFSMAHNTTFVNLSRTAGQVDFQFIDRGEDAYSSPLTAQGVTIDDVLITAYKYGPVRSLTATRVGDTGTVRLTWAKPYGKVGSSAEDTRSLAYRIWRAPISSPSSWQEVTSSSSRVTGTTFDDSSALADEYYQYFVQAWDTVADGNAYGEGNPAVDVVRVPAVGGKLVEFLPVEGTDRYGTAVAAVDAAFPSGASTIVLAYGGNFPDALGASALCGAWDAPLLLAKKDAIPPAVRTEISNLHPSRAIIVGNVLTQAVVNDLKDNLGVTTVDRVAGSDRYATASEVASATVKKLGAGSADDVFLAIGTNFPDALAASPAAFAKRWPILLTPATGLSGATRAAIVARGVKRVHILGGTSTIPTAIENDLKNTYGVTVDRWAGDNRYGTAVDVATKSGLAWSSLAIAKGTDFPDALAGGVMAGKLGGPVLLTKPTTLVGETAAAITAHKSEIAAVRYLGSTTSVYPAVRTSVTNLLQ